MGTWAQKEFQIKRRKKINNNNCFKSTASTVDSLCGIFSFFPVKIIGLLQYNFFFFGEKQCVFIPHFQQPEDGDEVLYGAVHRRQNYNNRDSNSGSIISMGEFFGMKSPM